MKTRQVLLLCAFAALALAPSAAGQSVTGQVSGRVTDPSGAVVAGAKTELINDLSRQIRDFTTDASGAFIFPGLVSGAYSLHVTAPGFKSYDQRGVTVAS